MKGIFFFFEGGWKLNSEPDLYNLFLKQIVSEKCVQMDAIQCADKYTGK